MNMIFKSFTLSFTAIFVALDVIGILPLFISLTKSHAPQHQTTIVNKSMAVAFLVAMLFAFAGQPLFHHLGIALYDFKMAGGLVLLLISLADLIGGPNTVNHASGSTGIVPLAVPLITGPSVLTTTVLQVGEFGYTITITSLLANYLLAWIILRHSNSVTRIVGNDGTVVISKIAAMLLTAISVSMIRTGVFEAIAANKIHP